MNNHTAKSAKVQLGVGEMNAPREGELKADRATISKFVDAVYRHCNSADGYIAARAFTHCERGWPVIFPSIKFGPDLIDALEAAATETANMKSAAAFAPPVCLFCLNDSAKAKDIAAGPVITVDMDQSPDEGKAKLLGVLGMATIIVASGGKWKDPVSGRQQDKLHLYWRLKKPAANPDELEKLRRARDLAAVFVGGDGSNNPISHPLRCPGSWHTKTDTPRLCSIVGGNTDSELDLDDALGRLEKAAGHLLADRGKRQGVEPREGFKTPRAWTAQSLIEAAHQLPCDLWEWEEWNKVGMAIYDASHGSEEGRDAFHTLSEKSQKYDPSHTDARWDHYHDYPPSDLSGSTLKYRMQEIDPTWLPTWPREGNSEASNVFALAGNDGPLDIFTNGDPAQLSDLPANAVPAKLERFIKCVSRRKGAPEAFATVSAITAIGAAIGAGVRVQVRQKDDTWTEAGNIWSFMVADPGSAKSPVISDAVQPLKNVDKRWSKVDEAKHNRWVIASKNRKKDAPAPGPEPRIRRAVVDDVTSEKQIRIFRDNPRGVLRTPDELAGLLGGFGQYKSGGGADREHFLGSFDGRDIKLDRVGSGTISADTATLSLIAGTQPDRLRDIVKNLGSDGLLQRMIVVLHDGKDRDGVDEDPDREALEWYGETLERLAENESTYPGTVRLNPEAGKRLAAAGKQIKLLNNIPGGSSQLKGHIAKWGKLLPRLTLIIHVARMMEEGERFDPRDEIEPDTVAMAVRLASFFLDHALQFYATYFGRTETASEARWIAEHLLAHPELKTVSLKDLYDARKLYRGPDGRRMAVAAMNELENFGWCWVNDWQAEGPKTWCIDERIHERFAEMAERVSRERKEIRQKIIASGNARALLRKGMEAPGTSFGGVFE
jgi:uncharacterized protein DUF3987/primase-like protein